METKAATNQSEHLAYKTTNASGPLLPGILTGKSKWRWITALLVSFSLQVSASSLLFFDDFDASKSTSLTDPSARAIGSLAASIKYDWHNTTDVVVDGMLNWDSDGNRNSSHQQPSDNGTQNVRINYDLYSQVGGKVWEVEFIQRVAWTHPLTFGLSDTSLAGAWTAWNSTSYDFAAGSYGSALRYDTDNDNGDNQRSVSGVFPNPPNTTDTHTFRIRFDEPNGTATVWVNGVNRAQLATLDFEANGRYLSWGEPTDYAGALDNLKIRVIKPEIVTLNPANNASAVATNANFVITFDENIKAGTGNVIITNLTDATATTIDITDGSQISISTSNLTINPTSDLDGGDSFAILIDSTAITEDVSDVTPVAFAGIANTTTWSFTTIGPPTAELGGGATAIGIGTATLHGELTVGGAADAYICWGETAGNTTTSSWANVISLGSKNQGVPFNTAISGLYYGVDYQYSVYVTNAAGDDWSSVTNFTTIPPYPSATGGNTTQMADGYRVHKFITSSDTLSVQQGGDVEVLVVGGGGGGGTIGGGGGGGAGGVIYTSAYKVLIGDIDVTVGAGGSGGNPGIASTFGTLEALGGGNGAQREGAAASGGGSGGGGAKDRTPGSGTAGPPRQGYNGGTGGGGNSWSTGGGGGGASTPGGNGGVYGDSFGGSGGDGLEFPQFAGLVAGSPTGWFGGGGGGGNQKHTPLGLGGAGGGGDGGNKDITAENAAANTGGGGGGSGGTGEGRAGGSGIVIVRYGSLFITNATAVAVSSSTANLSWTLNAPGSVFSVYAYYSTNDYTGKAAWESGEAVGITLLGTYTNASSAALTEALSGLSPDTTYHYALMATNAVTNLWTDAVDAFTTPADNTPPTVTLTGGASAIGDGTATLNGMLTAGTSADAYICWGTSNAGTSITSNWDNVISVGLALQDAAFSHAISNLYYGVRYYYTVYATNGAGEDWSTVTNFTTNPRAWTPANLSAAPAAWWDASDSANSAIISGKYQSLTDKTSNGHDVEAPASDRRPTQATWQGRQAAQIVKTGSSGDVLATSENVIGTTDDFTILSVMESSRIGRGADTYGAGWSINMAPTTLGIVLTSDGAAGYTTEAMPAGKLQAAQLDQGAGSSTMRFASDGRAFTSRTESKIDLRTSSRYFEWGTANGSSSSGYIGEVLVFTSIIPDAERRKLEGYLAWKWGMEGDLATGHDYEDAAPVHPLAQAIANTSATNILGPTATLQGTLDATNAVFTVTAYWSTSNHATGNDWLADDSKGSSVVGTYTNVVGQALSMNTTGLDENTDYYYTFAASNAVTTIWATPNEPFKTKVSGSVFRFR